VVGVFRSAAGYDETAPSHDHRPLVSMLGAAENGKRSPETGDLSLQVVLVAGARDVNERTSQIGATIPQRAIASITKRTIASSLIASELSCQSDV
jgi:hypothetical protein